MRAKTALTDIRIAAALAIVAAALTLQGCTDYFHPGADHHVEIDYKCLHWDKSLCREWRAQGVVTTRKNAFCFPGDATVITRAGPKRMSSVRIGDELMSFNHANGMAEFSAVRAWLHRETGTVAKMMRVRSDKGDIITSPEHSLAVGGERSFAFANEFHAGDMLTTPEGTSVIRDVSWEEVQGLFAPLTWTSNFFVGFGADANVSASFLAHSFAVVPHPQWFAKPFHALLTMVEFFSPSIHAIDENVEAIYLHPVCRYIMQAFGIPMGEGVGRLTVVDRTLVPSLPPNTSDAHFLRSRRLQQPHQPVHNEEDEELDDYLQVILDHPPFMFAIKDTPAAAPPKTTVQ